MPYPFACADFTFPLLSHVHALNLISMLEFDGVDIGLFEGRSHLWPSREFEDVKGSAKRLRSTLGNKGLKAADIFLQMADDFALYAINHPDGSRRAKAREWYLKSLDYASECGCHHVTILPGVHFETETLEQSLARAREELAWRVERAGDHAITLGFEAHVGSITSDPEAARALVESVPGLTLTLDYTHFTRLGMEDRRVEPLLDHASHFHVRGARRGRLQANFAENSIDYARIARRLQEIQYAGWIGIEYVWIDWEQCNQSDNVSETILFRDHMRSLLAGEGGTTR